MALHRALVTCLGGVALLGACETPGPAAPITTRPRPAAGPTDAASLSPSLAPQPQAQPQPGRATGERPATAGTGIARHVIIISEDGLRPDALTKAAPTVHGEVMRRGSYSLRATTIRRASTLPSHAAMLSGFDVAAHGLDWNSWRPERGFILVPTVFDAVTLAGGTSAAFVGKQKLAHIVHPDGGPRVFSRPGFLCKKVVEEAARYFLTQQPALEFVHFSDPDERGHAVGWMSDPQIASIRETDRCLATLLSAVHDAGRESDTLFILSADHGGHGRNHSGRIREDRLIPWIVWGPTVRAGHVLVGDVSTLDTAATALWALGYPMPAGIEGHPVREAFEPPPKPPER